MWWSSSISLAGSPSTRWLVRVISSIIIWRVVACVLLPLPALLVILAAISVISISILGGQTAVLFHVARIVLVGDGSLFLRSFPAPGFLLNRGSEASLDFCVSDLGGGAVEDALSAVAPLAAVRALGMKLPAEHLLAAPSSLLYFLTLFMAFMADADAVQRSFSALLPS